MDNFLQLNKDKTEIIIFAPSDMTSDIFNQLGSLSFNVHDCVKNLGVIFDSNLSFESRLVLL